MKFFNKILFLVIYLGCVTLVEAGKVKVSLDEEKNNNPRSLMIRASANQILFTGASYDHQMRTFRFVNMLLKGYSSKEKGSRQSLMKEVSMEQLTGDADFDYKKRVYIFMRDNMLLEGYSSKEKDSPQSVMKYLSVNQMLFTGADYAHQMSVYRFIEENGLLG